jgi:hypothetical protein
MCNGEVRFLIRQQCKIEKKIRAATPTRYLTDLKTYQYCETSLSSNRLSSYFANENKLVFPFLVNDFHFRFVLVSFDVEVFRSLGLACSENIPQLKTDIALLEEFSRHLFLEVILPDVIVFLKGLSHQTRKVFKWYSFKRLDMDMRHFRCLFKLPLIFNRHLKFLCWSSNLFKFSICFEPNLRLLYACKLTY